MKHITFLFIILFKINTTATTKVPESVLIKEGGIVSTKFRAFYF